MNGKEEYISPSKITKMFDITSNTLRVWSEQGKISCLRTNNGTGKRLYNVKEINKILGINTKPLLPRETICYARVSSDNQKEDLNRQIKFLSDRYPGSKIITDIGSGINFKRKGLEHLLEQVHSGNVKEVVVTYKDRLCRFGSELIEWIFKKSNTKLVVLNEVSEIGELSSKELSDDLLSIVTVFVAKNNGLRSAKFKKERKESDKQTETTDSNKNPKDK